VKLRALFLLRGELRWWTGKVKDTAPTVFASLTGWLAGTNKLRAADWRSGREARAMLLRSGWQPLSGETAEPLLAKAREQLQRLPARSRQAKALAYLLGGTKAPELLRAPSGKQVLIFEPEGTWPVEVPGPDPLQAQSILGSLSDPSAPLPNQVVELLSQVLPITTVLLLQKAGVRFRASDEVRLPEGLERLGPMSEEFQARCRMDTDSYGAFSAVLREIRYRPDLPAGLAAAVLIHEIAHFLVDLAEGQGLLDPEQWRVAGSDTPFLSIRAAYGLSELIPEVLAALISPHPWMEDRADPRLLGRERLKPTPLYGLATGLLGDQVSRLLQMSEVESPALDLDASLQRWVQLADRLEPSRTPRPLITENTGVSLVDLDLDGAAAFATYAAATSIGTP
jgi:hypothetical protein